MEEVQTQPGIHHRELLRRLRVSNGTLAYHLHQLERAGCIRSRRARGRKCLFVPPDGVDRESILVTDRERDVLAILSEGKDAPLEELSRRVGLNAGSVAYHIDRLRSLGFVEARREGHALVFFRTTTH